jgi:hypothetical protein
MVVTNDEGLYLNCSAFHDHGHEHIPGVERGWTIEDLWDSTSG